MRDHEEKEKISAIVVLALTDSIRTLTSSHLIARKIEKILMVIGIPKI